MAVSQFVLNIPELCFSVFVVCLQPSDWIFHHIVLDIPWFVLCLIILSRILLTAYALLQVGDLDRSVDEAVALIERCFGSVPAGRQTLLRDPSPAAENGNGSAPPAERHKVSEGL